MQYEDYMFVGKFKDLSSQKKLQKKLDWICTNFLNSIQYHLTRQKPTFLLIFVLKEINEYIWFIGMLKFPSNNIYFFFPPKKANEYVLVFYQILLLHKLKK